MKEFKPKTKNDQTAMYVSYAKDIFIALLDDIRKSNSQEIMEDLYEVAMERAIELIKYAKKELE